MVISVPNPSGGSWQVDLSRGIDLSIPYKHHGLLRAWYLGPVQIEPVVSGGWVGEVKQGGSVNFRTITFNPHAHGTHTESVGHISKEPVPVNRQLISCHELCRVITVDPQIISGDLVITREIVETAWNKIIENCPVKAAVIRTLPNGLEKTERDYCHTNPPYFEPEALSFLTSAGVDHLLVDLPSVDREEDGGKLAAHKAFWDYPVTGDSHRTITEFIFVPDVVGDGLYLLELQTANMENDAVPSRPVLFALSAE